MDFFEWRKTFFLKTNKSLEETVNTFIFSLKHQKVISETFFFDDIGICLKISPETGQIQELYCTPECFNEHYISFGATTNYVSLPENFDGREKFKFHGVSLDTETLEPIEIYWLEDNVQYKKQDYLNPEEIKQGIFFCENYYELPHHIIEKIRMYHFPKQFSCWKETEDDLLLEFNSERTLK